MDLQRQITELQARAEVARKQEFAEVIRRIREAIEVYGFTPEDLFPPASGRKTRRAKIASSATGTAPAKAAAKFRDPATGKTWTGNGKRPRWYVAALEAGATPESLAA